jgi:hypothetical protein
MRLFKVLAPLILLCCAVAGCGGPDKPAWLVNDPEGYDANSYVFGRGAGESQSEAEKQARLSILQQISPAYFDSQKPFVLLAEKNITTLDYWKDEKEGQNHVIAILDRREAVAPLWQAVQALEEGVDFALDQALKEPSRAEQMQRLELASELQRTRVAIAERIKAVQPDASIDAGAALLAEIDHRMRALLRGMTFNVEVQGDTEGVTRGGLVRAMAGKGLELAPAFDRDLLVQAQVELDQSPGRIEASALLKAFDDQGRLLESFDLSVQETETVSTERLLESLGRTAADRLIALLQRGGEGEIK